MDRFVMAVLVGIVGMAGCEYQEGETTTDEPAQLALGPVDGHDLSGVDIERVQVGQTAPDFSLVSLAGPQVTLSTFRGDKNVVLVFYRGHW